MASCGCSLGGRGWLAAPANCVVAPVTEYATFQRWRAILHQHVPPGPRGLRIICQPHLHELKIQDINGIATLVSGYSGS